MGPSIYVNIFSRGWSLLHSNLVFCMTSFLCVINVKCKCSCRLRMSVYVDCDYLCWLRLMSVAIKFSSLESCSVWERDWENFDRAVSAVSHFILPSLSMVLGWVVHLGCKLVELDVTLKMDRCVFPSVRVDCDHSCASMGREKVVRVAIDPPTLKLVLV